MGTERVRPRGFEDLNRLFSLKIALPIASRRFGLEPPVPIKQRSLCPLCLLAVFQVNLERSRLTVQGFVQE